MLLDVFIILLVAIKPVWTWEGDTEKHANVEPSTQYPCGQYGFRCIDSKRFQICPFKDSEGTTEEPDMVHECKDGFVCDEDNPAYCSPVDIQFTTIPFEEANLEYNDVQYINEKNDELYQDGESIAREPRGDSSCECKTTTTTEASTTSTESEYFTTLVIPNTPPFDCDTYGFFPDNGNKSLFWYCDVPPSGEGFLVRHMMCGNGRTFDPYKHACILEGTIRDIRTDVMDYKKCKISSQQPLGKFSCSAKSPGKYADDKDCQLYHVCLTRQFAPVKELLFTCPENTAFDPKTQRCSRRAKYRCLNKNCATEQIINKSNPKCGNSISCKTPSRFRDLRDCGGYFLCYGDQLLEMRCPEFYKFDDNMLECLPEGIARCDEQDDE